MARESGRGQPHSKKLARNRTLLLEILTSEPLAFRLRGEFFERHVEDRIDDTVFLVVNFRPVHVRAAGQVGHVHTWTAFAVLRELGRATE